MPDHLRTAAARRSRDAAERVRAALVEMTKARAPISFTSVARQASVSTDFLYRHLELRTKIETLRQTPRQAALPAAQHENAGSAVTALTERLRRLQAERNTQVKELKAALAAAHGENLTLRRRLEAAGITIQTD
jgi:chromosome segregation ATPase